MTADPDRDIMAAPDRAPGVIVWLLAALMAAAVCAGALAPWLVRLLARAIY